MLRRLPEPLDFAGGATIPVTFATALAAFDLAGLKAGERVLIHAGAGGVGSLAIQIAKILELHVTTTTSTKNVDFVRQLGADAVVDYTKHEPLPGGLDAAFDTLGGASELASLAAVKPGGTVVGIGGMPDAAFARTHLPAFARPVIWLATSKRRRAAARRRLPVRSHSAGRTHTGSRSRANAASGSPPIPTTVPPRLVAAIDASSVVPRVSNTASSSVGSGSFLV